MLKPKYAVLILSTMSIVLTFGTIATGSLLWIALSTIVGYMSQGIFVFYTTGRRPWELLFGISAALIAIITGALPLQFLGRVVFVANAAHTAYKLLENVESF